MLKSYLENATQFLKRFSLFAVVRLTLQTIHENKSGNFANLFKCCQDSINIAELI
jgi:hypothetical protein